MVASGAFVEAWATVHGTMANQPVRGRAYCEVVPGNRIGRMEEFLGRLREITMAEVQALYPEAPSEAATAGLAGVDAVGLPHESVHDALVRPLRHMTDASGRGWRTFVTCAAIEMFDVRCDPYLPLLAVVELSHTGNLVVDDVEDSSPMRRGVPAVHTLYGVPTAINAGTAAYFVLDRVVPQILPDDDRLRVHQTYTGALWAGHVGQAMDLAVATGDATAVLDAHRLKTGTPARAFGEIGGSSHGATTSRSTPSEPTSRPSDSPTRSPTTCWTSTARRKWYQQASTTARTCVRGLLRRHESTGRRRLEEAGSVAAHRQRRHSWRLDA
jgi:hypothetical protein